MVEKDGFFLLLFSTVISWRPGRFVCRHGVQETNAARCGQSEEAENRRIMKLQQLKYLLAIADNGLNITAAAEKLYTSQPGVSKQLKLLEEELGIQIFTRKGKSLGAITPAGQKIIDRSRVIMQEVDNIRTLASDYFEEEEGALSIATTHTQARYVLPEIVRAFRERFPNVRLDLHQGTSEQIADMVAANRIDFAIATGSHELFGDLLLVPSYRWERTIIVPNDHELTRLDRKLTLDDLAKYPLVTYVFSFGGESSLKRAFAERGLEPDVVFTARDADVIKTYVRMGMGVGIVAAMADECGDRNDLVRIDASGLFPVSTTWIGFRKDAVLRRYMQEFLQLFAPHVSDRDLDDIAASRSQASIDALFPPARLPQRTGCDDRLGPQDSMAKIG
jgi:LysR family cys regulon transcriptional activator